MLQHDHENAVFEMAAQFIKSSNRAVFLTGKAGTGKTTFLKYIKENVLKSVAIVAPTGVAAINAGGVTIHSFFNLPFSPFVPNTGKRQFGNSNINDKHALIGKLKLNTEKKELLQSLELLIIDEISMVRCDLLDSIDTVLRSVRNMPHQPFGGVQVLYIGDMYQLPPVVKDEEWQILSAYYENPYFFSSSVVTQQQPVYIELEKVYRQKDLLFVELLNKVRNNSMDKEGYDLLHSRYIPGFVAEETENFITLTTHNNTADEINAEALKKITSPVRSFYADIDGVFPENSFPVEEKLHLKEGARVMFLKNDTEKVRRYYNGKIGTVHKIEGNDIWIECLNGDEPSIIEVKKETWQNIRYSLNQKKHQVEEEVMGSFSQFPLRLAWAITIHKSQGLTFDKVIVDAGRAFTSGQVYVALSRCTTLEGLVLKSSISYRSLNSDDRVVQFATKQQQGVQKDLILSIAKKEYQQEIIKQLFSFTRIEKKLNALIQWNTENKVFPLIVADWLESIKLRIDTFSGYSVKFSVVLDNLFLEDTLPEKNVLLQERIKKASQWFIPELEKTAAELSTSPAITDNRQRAHEYTIQLRGLLEDILFQKHLMSLFETRGFSIQDYNEQKTGYLSPPIKINAYAGVSAFISKDILHPDLYLELKDFRNQLAEENNVPIYMICGTDSLKDMANYMPLSIEDLGKISGFGPTKLKQYGKKFISLINSYREENNIQTDTIDIPQKKKGKPKSAAGGIKKDTKRETFSLYSEGKSLAEIASIRNLAISTIEGHLAYFVETGEINIGQLVDIDKQQKAKQLISTGITGLAALKQELQNEFSFGELKWILAAEKRG